MVKMRYSRFTDPIGTEDESDEFELTAAEVDQFVDVGVEAKNVYDEGVIIYDLRKKNISNIKTNRNNHNHYRQEVISTILFFTFVLFKLTVNSRLVIQISCKCS